MCFDRGTQKKKLDNFLTFFQVIGSFCFYFIFAVLMYVFILAIYTL